MSSTITPRIGLSYMSVGQAQKELAHSQSMARLDAITQAVVQTVGTLNAPPGSPAEGQGWIVGPSPTGAWAGKANDLAYYINASWIFITKFIGMKVYNVADDLEYRWSGSAWDVASGGGANFGRMDVPPTASTFTTWVNQGSASLDTSRSDRVALIGPSQTTDNWRCVMKSTPATPYRCIFRFSHYQPAKSAHHSGICLQESGTGKFEFFVVLSNPNTELFIAKYDNATGTGGAALYDMGTSFQPEYMAIRDNGTTRYFEIGDGYTWVTLFSEARTTHITPDRIGLTVNPWNTGTPNLDSALICWSYEETTP